MGPKLDYTKNSTNKVFQKIFLKLFTHDVMETGV